MSDDIQINVGGTSALCPVIVEDYGVGIVIGEYGETGGWTPGGIEDGKFVLGVHLKGRIGGPDAEISELTVGLDSLGVAELAGAVGMYLENLVRLMAE